MKKPFYMLFALVAMLSVVACNDYETYAEQREKEDNAIREFIQKRNINVITEAQFRDKGYTTDVSKNEYVLISSNGVYMQIVRKGCGRQMNKGETATVLCRFKEYNVFTDSITLTNEVLQFNSIVDKMTVTRTSDTYTGTFIEGESVMVMAYSYTDVRGGWLTPLNHINIGRPEKEGDEIAKVNVIVPAAQGTYNAVQSVTPYYYEITYEKGI